MKSFMLEKCQQCSNSFLNQQIFLGKYNSILNIAYYRFSRYRLSIRPYFYSVSLKHIKQLNLLLTTLTPTPPPPLSISVKVSTQLSTPAIRESMVLLRAYSINSPTNSTFYEWLSLPHLNFRISLPSIPLTGLLA